MLTLRRHELCRLLDTWCSAWSSVGASLEAGRVLFSPTRAASVLGKTFPAPSAFYTGNVPRRCGQGNSDRHLLTSIYLIEGMEEAGPFLFYWYVREQCCQWSSVRIWWFFSSQTQKQLLETTKCTWNSNLCLLSLPLWTLIFFFPF